MNNQIILKAANFAAQKHKNQRRKDVDSSPYINHPISVAKIISIVGKIQDPEILAAALLHDTIEDTETTSQELMDNFGERVSKMVLEVTDDKNLSKIVRKQKQIEDANKLSMGAALIKLGDKISNVTDITNTPPINWNIKRRLEYFDWAEKVINNCPKVNKELENYFADLINNSRSQLQ